MHGNTYIRLRSFAHYECMFLVSLRMKRYIRGLIIELIPTESRASYFASNNNSFCQWMLAIVFQGVEIFPKVNFTEANERAERFPFLGKTTGEQKRVR